MNSIFKSIVLATVLFCCGSCIQAHAAPKPKVLVVISSSQLLTLRDGKKFPTGFFLNELGGPVKALVDAGFEPVFANPLGNKETMDMSSDKPVFFGADAKEYAAVKSLVESLPGLQHPKTLSDVAAGDLSQYAGIFVPGGHAPMEDLWNQPALGNILRYFHDRHKPTALICHGPIALMSTLENPSKIVDTVEQKVKAAPIKSWTYAGYNMTVFSDAEEKLNEPGRLGGYMKFHPEEALRQAGGNVIVAPPKQSHVVIDRELITGQNPFSDKELAGTLLKALTSSQKQAGGHAAKQE